MNPGTDIFGINLKSLKSGTVKADNISFQLKEPVNKKDNALVAVGVYGAEKNPLIQDVKGIKIDEDVSSLIFLHACALPAGNQKSYFDIYNTFDTSDLLGWYEVVYEDGYKEVIPIQYGVNILEWNPGGDKSLDNAEGDTGSAQNAYCYAADIVNCSSDMIKNPIKFYSYEWVNKRFGKKILQVNMMGSKDYQAVQPVYDQVVTEPLPSNAIMLLGISKVQKREIAPWK